MIDVSRAEICSKARGNWHDISRSLHRVRSMGMKAENIIGPASIVEKPERPYLGIRFDAPFGGMFLLVTKALKELRKWGKENSLSEEGPYFVR